MNRQKRFKARASRMAAGLLIVACSPIASRAQETQPASEAGTRATRRENAPQGRVGIVTGDRVNVRSGSDRNYYPVTRLNAGDKVVVVGEEYGWLEILPPEGTYSLIEKTYVTRKGDGNRGTVNESVWVRAGSTMSPRRYARQVKLDRGASVTILGESEDGDFYRIVPPKGATLWITGDYVDLTGRTEAAASPASPDLEPVEPGTLLDEPGAPGTIPEAATTTTRESSTVVTETPEGITRTETIERTQTRTTNEDKFQSQYQIEIKALEAEIAAEAAKPLRDQEYTSILERLETLAAQEEDELTQKYAQARRKQIQQHVDLIDTLKRVETLTSTAIEKANTRQRERARIQAEEAISPDNIVATGEIEVSAIYRGQSNRPQRWRLVEKPDPSQRVRDVETFAPRTVAYLELPANSTLDLNDYIGKYVGIRATKRRYIREAIPPIPVYTVEDVVVMEDRRPTGSTATQPAGSGRSRPGQRERNRAVVASPESSRISAPVSTRPAAVRAPLVTGEWITSD